jgi:hypothetical protein
MFKTRPRSPVGTLVFGAVFFVVGLAAAYFAFADPYIVTPRGIPVWLLAAGLLVCGAYFLALGGVWRRRDRH